MPVFSPRPPPSAAVLLIKDEGTTGLEGDSFDTSSGWFRFLLLHGDSGKPDDGGSHTGGSYGFGKTALSSASRLRCIFAYTRWRAEDGEKTRLMGCAYLDAFSHGDARYTGRAFLGRDGGEHEGGKVIRPWEGEEADRLAERLAMRRREAGMLGTTVLVVDAVPEMTPEGIRSAVETWWWPRIADRELDVVVTAEDGTQRKPDSRGRKDLRPFLRCWDLLADKDARPGPSEDVIEFNPFEERRLGRLAVQAEEQQPEPEADDADGDSRDFRDRIALVRFPKMVVQYFDPGGRGALPVRGVFRAHDDIDPVLRLAEPPAHDRWESTSARLPDDISKEAMRSVLKRIKNNVSRFRRSVRPPDPPAVPASDELSRMLADLLAPAIPSRTGQGSTASPVSIQFEEQPRAHPADESASLLKLSSVVKVALSEEADGPLRVRVRFACPILEEETDGDEELSLIVDAPADVRLVDEDPPTYEGNLHKGQGWRFRIESAPYDADWSVRFEPRVEVVPG